MKKRNSLVYTPPTDGLIGFWDGNGNWEDRSGNGNNGTATNVSYEKTPKGYQEQCGVFNKSSNSQVKILDNSIYDNNNKIFISAIFNIGTGGLSNNPTIFSTQATVVIRIQLYSSGNMGCIIRDSGGTLISKTTSGITLQENTDYQCIMRYNGSTLRAYINGIKYLEYSQILSGNLNPTKDLYIGYDSNLGSGGTTGNIQTVRFYTNKDFTEEERLGCYYEFLRKIGNNGYADLFEGLSFYADFRNGLIQDISGNDITLTNNGTTATTDRFGISNNARNFDGVNDDINTNIPGINEKCCFIMRTNTTSTASQHIISYTTTSLGAITISYNHRSYSGNSPGYINVYMYGDGKERYFYCNIGSYLYNGDPEQVIINIDNTTSSGGEIYFNGVKQTLTQGTTNTIGDNIKEPLRIGSKNSTGFYAGTLDELIILDRNISETEAKCFSVLTTENGTGKYIYELDGHLPTYLRNGLVAHYTGGSDAKDLSGNGNHGTNNGVSDIMINGKVGGDYDGTSSYISTPSSYVNKDGKRFYYFWIKLDVLKNVNFIWNYPGDSSKLDYTYLGQKIYINSSGEVIYGYSGANSQDSYFKSTLTIEANKGYFIAIYRNGNDSNNGKIRINGVECATSLYNNNTSDPGSYGTGYIGKYGLNNIHYLDGELMNFNISNMTPNDNIIEQLYYRTFPTFANI